MPEGKTRFVPAPLVGGTSQLPAVDQFASAPRPVQLLVVTSRASSCSLNPFVADQQVLHDERSSIPFG